MIYLSTRQKQMREGGKAEQFIFRVRQKKTRMVMCSVQYKIVCICANRGGETKLCILCSLFLSNFSAQCGPQTHNPKIKSLALSTELARCP